MIPGKHFTFQAGASKEPIQGIEVVQVMLPGSIRTGFGLVNGKGAPHMLNKFRPSQMNAWQLHSAEVINQSGPQFVVGRPWLAVAGPGFLAHKGGSLIF